MFTVMRSWIDRFLSEEESVLLAFIITGSVVVILTMGQILAPLLTGIVLAYIMQGTIKAMQKINVPKGLAVFLTFIIFLGAFISLLVFVIPRVWRQLQALFNNFPTMVEKTRELLVELPTQYPDMVSRQQVNSWIDMMNAEAGDIGQWLLSFSLSQLPVVVAMAVYIMLVPLLVFFILKDQQQILRWCASFLPKERPLLNRIGQEMDQQMANYVRGKVIEIILVGGSSYIFFTVMGLDYAALLGFLVGLSVIVPYVGVVAVTFPVVIIGYLQFGWVSTYFYVLLGYGIIQGIDGFVIVPLLFSEAVNLHPIAIICAVLVFGAWWGLWGVFFAIPLATLIKAVMSAWPQVGQVSSDKLVAD